MVRFVHPAAIHVAVNTGSMCAYVRKCKYVTTTPHIHANNFRQFSFYVPLHFFSHYNIFSVTMGNCNSESTAKQKCTGCGFKKCECTAGLNSVCGRCDPSWKYQVPGTYDAQYNAWVRANPRPVKPIFDPQPPLNSMDFVCTQCVQCQDFSNITAGGSLDIKDPTQVMQCIGKMKDKQEEDERAEAERAAAELRDEAERAAADARAANEAAAKAAADQKSKRTMIIVLIVMVLLILIIIGVVVAVSFSGGTELEEPTLV
jgi:hypothetical protein